MRPEPTSFHKPKQPRRQRRRSKQQLCPCVKLFSTFLWRPLHDYDVKPPNASFYGGSKHTTTNFPFSFWTWIKSLRIQLQEKSPTFDKLRGPVRRDKVWKDANSFFSDIFTVDVIVVGAPQPPRPGFCGIDQSVKVIYTDSKVLSICCFQLQEGVWISQNIARRISGTFIRAKRRGQCTDLQLRFCLVSCLWLRQVPYEEILS